MKNGSSVEMNKWSQTVELIKFEPVTLARLDGIPTPAHGNEKLFVLVEIISHHDIIIEILKVTFALSICCTTENLNKLKLIQYHTALDNKTFPPEIELNAQ